MIRQGRDVLGPFAQRRHRQGQHVQPVEQILAKPALGDGLAQAHIGRGDDADIQADGFAAADAADLAFLQEAQQVALQVDRHVADFVQEQRAAVGILDLADACGRRRR